MSKIEHPLLGSFIFVHSMLDDAGLSANEFRVYAHIARRAGNGTAFPAVASIADVCRIHKDTVWAVLRSLEERGMVVRIARTGAANIYRLTDPKAWTNPSKAGSGKEGAPETEGWGAPENKGCHPPEMEGYEGTPTKDIQRRTPTTRIEAEAIYQAYPRKVGKLAALKAIEKALKSSDHQTILASVNRFAEQVKAERTEERFIPHPSTWFNQGRWMDESTKQPAKASGDWGPFGDPSTWPSHWIKHPTENRPMRPGEMQ